MSTPQAGTWRLDEGMRLDSTDGPGGRVEDVIIDRDRLTLTHVILTPRTLFAFPRLVPAEAIDPGGPRPSLTWSTQRVLGCPVVRHVAHVGLGESVPHEDGSDIGVINVSARAQADTWDSAGGGVLLLDYDVIPAGTAEIRHASRVQTRDDHEVGRVEGFLVATEGRAVTGVIVAHGHPWHRREITVPSSYVATVRTDGIRLRLTRDDLHQHLRRRTAGVESVDARRDADRHHLAG